MKLAGTLVLLASVLGIATFEDAVPAEGRAWALRLVRYALYLMFVGGLYLFGAGLKREILAELRRGPTSPPG
jgi:hypothetical protein